MAVYTTIDIPELYFQTVKYSGNNTGLAITLSGSEDMSPDLVWNKSISNTEEHNMWDSVRGTTKGAVIQAASESTWATGLTSFDSDGWTMGELDSMNDGSVNFVAWCWVESATAGFDIDISSGTGSARTEAHSLSAVAHTILMKARDDSTNWAVYHHRNTSAPATDYLRLNTTKATADDAERWNDTDPTSSVFSMGTDSEVNASGNDYLSYLWSEKQGFSKFGAYTGNGNADGPFINLGFRPAFFMVKNTGNGSAEWRIYDSVRDPFNKDDNNVIVVNANSAEAAAGENDLDFLSNGIKIGSTDGNINQSGYAHVYWAFAEAPLVNSNGVPCNAR